MKKLLYILLPFLLLAPSFAYAAIAFDNATTNSGSISLGTQSYTHVTSGSDRILYVHVYDTSLAGDIVTGVTYGGVSMTKVGFLQIANNTGTVDLFRLVNPATGSNTVTISYSVSLFGASIATSYTGAKQSGGVFVSNTTNVNSTSASVSLTPNSSNNWIVMAMGNQGAAPFGASGSAAVRQVGSNVAIVAYDTNGTVGNTSITMGVTETGNPGIGLIAESFEPTVTAATFIKVPDILSWGWW